MDGATGTALLAAGMPTGVCTEQWILENPEPLLQLQRRYAAAGCDVITAPTFGANRARLAAFGLEEQTATFNRRLVALSRQAAPGCKIAGNLSPTGRRLEPYGEEGEPVLSMEEAVAIFEEQAIALKEAGADLLLVETMTSLNEARAALLAARSTGLPVFVTMAVDEEGRTLSGARLLPCVITLQALGAAAVGVNCCSIQAAREQLEEALPYAQVPLIAQPSVTLPDGGVLSPLRFSEDMADLLGAGAAVVGGCCGSLPEHMAVLRGLLDRFPVIGSPEVDGHAAAGEQEAFFLGDDPDPSPPLPCDSNLADAFIEAEDAYNAARVHVAELEDIPVLLEAARVCRLPIMVYTDDALVLDAVLLRFPGRLLVDSLCEIERELLEDIAAHFGAILF